MRAVFPPEALKQVAAVIRAHRKPGIGSESAKKIGSGTALGGTSRPEKWRLPSKAGPCHPGDGPTAKRSGEVTPISTRAASARLTSSGVSGIRSLCAGYTAV